MNNFTTNDFTSRSPESSSSTESQLVSPPQQFFPSSSSSLAGGGGGGGGGTDFTFSSTITTTNVPLAHPPSVGSWSDTYYYNNHDDSSAEETRSASVPPHFHNNNNFKPNQQDNSMLYNQFQVTSSLHHSYQRPHLPTAAIPASKPLPIQIQRVNATRTNTQNSGPSSSPTNTEAYRRQLDERLEKVNFDDITVAELKEMLRERGLSATGRKAELMNRLKQEYELLMQRGGSAAAAVAAAAVNNNNGGAVAPVSPALSTTSASGALHRRVANLNIDSPIQKNSRQQRLYSPYSPPPTTRHVSLPTQQRLASSVPDSHTPSYLNDQFMLKKKPSCLRKSIDSTEEEEVQPRGKRYNKHFVSLEQKLTDFFFLLDWLTCSLSPSNSMYHLTVPKIEEAATTNEFVVVPPPSTDIWDDQTLQTFLNQI